MTDLFRMQQGVEMRWATAENPRGEKGKGGSSVHGRKGSPSVLCFKQGTELVLAEAEKTPGTVRRIWITHFDRTPRVLRGIRLDFYWDGAAKPAISVPIGDFFGHSLGRMTPFENALFSSPEGRSYNCIVPMPFHTGMRIVAVNETGEDVRNFFYEVDYTIGDQLGPDALYFHAHFARERSTKLRQDYEILPQMNGRGRYLGALVGVIANQERYYSAWWGEGEVKIYLDGDSELPTLVGTGTEDYIGTGWGQGRYSQLYQGCPLADHKALQYTFYRLHVPDPIFFHRDIRVTIQQIGFMARESVWYMLAKGEKVLARDGGEYKLNKDSFGLFERQEDDWCSCAYFYLDTPTHDLPAIPSVEDRVFGLTGDESASKRLDA